MNIKKSVSRQNQRVFAFQRVSTKEQAEGASLTEQRRVIREFCQRRSLEIVGNIEEVQTAAKTGRTNFEAMVKALKKGNADGIVFHKVDRSSRNYRDWLTISDNAASVVDDVTRIRNHPLVPAGIPIYGYIYDVTTGRLVEIEAATAAGAAQ